jgi:hypothetical protein
MAVWLSRMAVWWSRMASLGLLAGAQRKAAMSPTTLQA